MKGYVIYDPSSGEILSTTTIDEDAQLGSDNGEGITYPLPTDESYILFSTDGGDDAEDDTYYYDDLYKVDLTTLTIVPKTYIDTPLTLSTTVNVPVVIAGLPDCTAEYAVTPPEPIDTEELASETYIASDDITDGTLNLTVDLAGSYTIVLTSPIYLPTIIELTVEND